MPNITKRNKQKISRLSSSALPYLDEYLLHLQSNHYSERTVYNYERHLLLFQEFLHQETRLPFKRISKKTVEEFKAFLGSRDRPARRQKKGNTVSAPLSSHSTNTILSALRSYLSYLLDMDYPCPLPPDAIKLVRKERPHSRVADLDDIVRLIESPNTFEKDKTVALRNRAILEMFFSTGLRLSELLSINRDQIDKHGRIFVKGKGKKERYVYLTPRALQHLQSYLSTRTDDEKALFIPTRGKHAHSPSRRLSSSYIQRKIKVYREALSIPVPVSAHSIRHAFATYLAEGGASPAAIQTLLGHESLDTTTRYVNPSDRFAEETQKKFHPLRK